jgi:hypothetical protein
MKLLAPWRWLLIPHKFYGGGGGGGQTAQINPEEQALANISQEKWDEYKARYVPLENQWIDKSNTLNNQNYHNDASGMASNEVKAQYGQQTGGLASSVQGQRIGKADYLNQAENITQARNKANLGVTDRYLRGQEGVIAMGQGQSATALQGMNDVANTSVDAQIRNNENKFKQQQSNQGMYGTIAGAAVAGTTNNMNKAKK